MVVENNTYGIFQSFRRVQLFWIYLMGQGHLLWILIIYVITTFLMTTEEQNTLTKLEYVSTRYAEYWSGVTTLLIKGLT